MRPYREAFLDVCPTAAAGLRREARGDSHHHMTSSRSLVREDVEKRAPTRVVNAFREMMVLHHPTDVEVLHADATVPLGIVFGGLEVEVTALATDLEMLARDFACRFAAPVAALRAAADRALGMG